MLKIAICDDDAVFTSKLETLVLNECKNLKVRDEIDVFFDGKSLLKSILLGEHYSIIFIDIEMKEMDGINAARKIRQTDRTVLLIYISGYDNYLKELFEVEPFRFLSKPIQTQLFSKYFKDAYSRILETSNTFFQYKFNKEICKIMLGDIVYFESKNRIINIFLSNGTQTYFYGKLNTIEKDLSKSNYYFLRIHQSFLVNYDYIIKLNFYNATINLSGKQICLKISEDRQKNVRQQICDITSRKAGL